VSLNFYQTQQQTAVEYENVSLTDLEEAIQHRALSVTKSAVSAVSVFSDDLEVNWEMEMTDSSRMGSPKIEYEPISLCAISVQPLFDILKVIIVHLCVLLCALN